MIAEELYKTIDEVRFRIISPQEIRKYSVVEIRTADTYDEDGVPIASGLMDGRLGALEPGQRCKTCGNTAARCPGHFGHIELAAPVIHVEFTKVIHDLLSATCRVCGRILIRPGRIVELKSRMEQLRKSTGDVPREFHEEVLREAKAKECPYCGEHQRRITFEKPTDFKEESPEGVVTLTPSAVRERLERLIDEDLELMGFDPRAARPEWMILQVLPVPPVYVRPSITLESGIRSEDDLTHKLVDIIRINQRLKESIELGAPELINEDLAALLQYHVTTYFNNEASGIPPARHRSGRALKALSQRLQGKEGRFRGSLSGKRVDFSARTVISPDPNLDIDEVGVPLDVAMRISTPEKVTEWNLEEMRQLIINGPDRYPGALYLVRPDGKRIRLEFIVDRVKLAEMLQPGFVVERHLRDGDIVIFNRQPSLHRMSIMAHVVRVLPHKTFRLHLCACPPYNADFDGDEMNLHVPQSEEAQTEAHLLMKVEGQILSPRFGGPIIGAIRDFITAAYLLTKNSTHLTKDEVCQLLTAADYEGGIPEPDVKEPKPLWSGKKIFSLFLPKGFNHVAKANICRNCEACLYEECPYDAYIVIKDGELICGVIDRKAIGAEQPGGLLHRITKEYGVDEGKKFLNKICQLLKSFITMRGFSYSYDEVELSLDSKRKIAEIMQKYEGQVQELINEYKEGILKKLPGQTLEESFEIYVMNELAEARDEAGGVADESLSLENSGIIMTETGARGSSLNVGQMLACVGQQSIRGKRIMRGYEGRTLPHFNVGDPSPKARGFVRSSYQEGLNPLEFFFHAMGGREGLVDTAVRTQQSGYMQRRLINALEHLWIEYDGTVRSPAGDVIQFKYGEDSVDPTKSYHGAAVDVRQSIERMKMEVKGEPASMEYIEERVKGVEGMLPRSLTEELKEGLKAVRLPKEGVDKAVELTIECYKQAQVEPGEAVGIVAAQSIGEPGTQMTLRTFHYAGVREQNVTLGLPRLIEVIDAHKVPSTPIMTIRLDEEHRRSLDKAKEVARRIQHTSVKDVVKNVYRTVYDEEREGIMIELNPVAMKERGLTMEDLVKSLSLPDCSVEEKGIDAVIIKPIKPLDLKKLMDRVLSHSIRGVPRITQVRIDEEEGEWIIRTDGSNLRKVLYVPGVDPTRTETNNIHEVFEVLGIEAATRAIVKEAKGVLEEQGLDVDIRHIMLVADVMCATGDVKQVGRHGVVYEKESVLARSAFELTVSNIVEAAVRGVSDSLKGATESVLVGQTIPIGTGLVDVYMTMQTAPEGSSEAFE